MSSPVVMKFGGTSVANAGAMQHASRIVARAREAGTPIVVVVSAMAGVTDLLISACEAAGSGSTGDVARIVAALAARHSEVVERLFVASPAGQSLLEGITEECGDLRQLLARPGTAAGLTGPQSDRALAAGELMSSRIFAALLAADGVPARWIDSRRVVVTNDSFGAALPLDLTRAAAAREVAPALSANEVAVLAGFIGATPDGLTTTLGRGGSDFSAALIGAALDAREIQIWTDVDGMLTSDPRLVRGAMPVERLSFEEASELAYFGAKVLHPSTILPAVEKSIPVRILNTMRPGAAGSLIAADAPRREGRLTAIACKRRITLINITSTRMLLAYGFLRRVFEVFERHATCVDVVTTSEVSVSVTVDDDRRVDAIAKDLTEIASLQVERGMAIISAVGDNLRTDPSIAVDVVTTLGRFPLRMVSQAASRRNVTVVLHDDDVPAAMRGLHEEFFSAIGVEH
jgi:aspartate kinase